MNLEMQISRVASRRHNTDERQQRLFWSPSMGRNSVESVPRRLRALGSLNQSQTSNPEISKRDSKKQKMDEQMRISLSGMGGKRAYLASLDRGTLHLLMALKESGRDDLVRQALASGDQSLEWKVSLRHSDASETK